ncbi:hypothetical protein L249_7294, partial [Ophiocordyceps polyrhachis-furcata BCC 54312]
MMTHIQCEGLLVPTTVAMPFIHHGCMSSEVRGIARKSRICLDLRRKYIVANCVHTASACLGLGALSLVALPTQMLDKEAFITYLPDQRL